VPTHKLFPGRAISLEALLNQLGVLLQRKISLVSTRASLRTAVTCSAAVRPVELLSPATLWNVNCPLFVPQPDLATDKSFAAHLTRPIPLITTPIA
jgi:hypothetical protein